MTPFINDQLAGQIRQIFSEMHQPVEIQFFQKNAECDLCPETRQLLEEVGSLSDLIKVEIHDLETDNSMAEQLGIHDSPVFALTYRADDGALVDPGIRFLGIPSGHEFTSLVNDLVMVSNRESALSEQTKSFLKELTQPVLLQVFTTPTCPYCPRAVVLAHQMALESPMVQAEMVDAAEFMELANRFSVSGVPQTTINSGAGTLVGAGSEEYLVSEIRQALSQAA